MRARAVVMTGPRALELREFDVPAAPPAGGAIMAVGVNGLCGSDYDLYVGHLDRHYTPFPLIPGHEMVGRIAAIDGPAEAAWGIGVGDRVAVEPVIYCGNCADCLAGRGRFCRRGSGYSSTSIDVAPSLWGGMADYMVLRPGTRLHRIPETMTDEDAGLCNPFGNAFEWTAQAGRVRPGDRVLITGCGQRGLACAVVAKESGAAQVIVTGLARDAHKLALAEEFGADHAINVEAADTVGAVRELTDGAGIDRVIDTAPGAASTIVEAIEVLRNEGTLVLAGEKGREVTGLLTDKIHRKGLTIRGAFATSPWSTKNAIRVLAEGRYPFTNLHSHVVGLDGVEDGIRMLGGEIDKGPVLHISVKPSLTR